MLKKLTGKALIHTILIITSLLSIFPFIWLTSTSLKGLGEDIFAYPPHLIPSDFTWANYVDVWHRVNFMGYFFFAILATIMIPFQAIMLPVYIITLKLHLIDSVNNVMGYIGLVMPFAVSAFGIFLMRQAFIKVPKEVEEAAIVDGCNVFQMFTRVVIPMVKPTLAVLAVFTFIGSWGEFLWPSIMLTKDAMYTLPVGINNLQGMFSSNWRFIAAGSIISTIPIIVFFLMMQRYFISGENDGAVKG